MALNQSGWMFVAIVKGIHCFYTTNIHNKYSVLVWIERKNALRNQLLVVLSYSWLLGEKHKTQFSLHSAQEQSWISLSPIQNKVYICFRAALL